VPVKKGRRDLLGPSGSRENSRRPSPRDLHPNNAVSFVSWTKPTQVEDWAVEPNQPKGS